MVPTMEFTAKLRAADDRKLQLQVVQPGLVGLIDGTVSTLAPIFAAAYLAGSHTALLVGLATALGAAISMGLSEALSDDGAMSGRGSSLARGTITGAATFAGGSLHSLPFLISDVHRALTVAYVVVACELFAIAWVRKRFQRVSLANSLIQVTLGGGLVAAVGYAVGHG
jgi:VIT1/CCC1 family predicted Fe2+/Mn2+ transporter